jgi:TonB family protein
MYLRIKLWRDAGPDVSLTHFNSIKMTQSLTIRFLAASILSLAMGAFAQASDSTVREELHACAKPDYPKEAARLQIDGITRLGVELDASGMVEKVEVLKGSGWNVLDTAAIAALAKCQFSPELAASKKKFFVHYWFRSSDLNPGVSRPVLRADSCAPSEIFTGFTPSHDETITDREGVLMRFDVSELGDASHVQFEDRAWDPRLLNAASAFIQSCKFTPSKRAGVKSRGGMSGRLLLKTQLAADAPAATVK